MRKLVCLLFLALPLLTGLHEPLRVAADGEDRKADRWADSVYAQLNVRERIGQLMMVAAHTDLGPAHTLEVQRLVEDEAIGGLIFQNTSPFAQASLTQIYQARAKVPLLIGMSIGDGLTMGIDSVMPVPGALTLGATGDPSAAYRAGALAASRAHRLGAHVIFAPVTNVADSDNREHAYHTFGNDRALVTGMATSYMSGISDKGMMPVAKYFPYWSDRDAALPHVLQLSEEELTNQVLLPFRAIVEKGVPGIQMSQVLVPAWDGARRGSATLSQEIIGKQLREELNFDGIVFSGELDTKGLERLDKGGSLALAALVAGCDMLLMPADVREAIDEIEDEIGKKKPRFSKKNLENKVKKLLIQKYLSGLQHRTEPDMDNLTADLNSGKAIAISQKISEEAITLLADQGGLLPFKNLELLKLATLNIGDGDNQAFVSTCDKYVHSEHFYLRDRLAGERTLDSIFTELSRFGTVIINLQGLGHSPANNYGLSIGLVSKLLELDGKTDLVLVVMGTPYAAGNFSGISHLICAYEDSPLMQVALVQAIFGANPISGRLPLSVNATFRRGTGLQRESLQRLGYSTPEYMGLDSKILKGIDRIANEAISHQATPGCQVVVAKGGTVIYNKGFGYYTYDSLEPVTDQTVYDIASVTKVAATLQAVMFLADWGMLDLSKKASFYLPELKKTNKENLQIRDILAHQAGLKSWIPFWQNTVDKTGFVQGYYSERKEKQYTEMVAPGMYTTRAMSDSLWQWVITSKLMDLPRGGRKYSYTYSDLGFYIMKMVVERLTHQPLDQFVSQQFYEPLGATTLTFNPLVKYSVLQIAPTENDVYFRNALIRGTVHDQGGAMLGGVAGHAGLFSNANDLAKLMQMNLQKGYYGGRFYFHSPETIPKFTSKQFSGNRRGLGWDKQVAGIQNGPTSILASRSTFGHTGFTGTCVWADPDQDMVYVFLSNRVYPSADNKKLLSENVRTRIQGVIYEAIVAAMLSGEEQNP